MSRPRFIAVHAREHPDEPFTYWAINANEIIRFRYNFNEGSSDSCIIHLPDCVLETQETFATVVGMITKMGGGIYPP